MHVIFGGGAIVLVLALSILLILALTASVPMLWLHCQMRFQKTTGLLDW